MVLPNGMKVRLGIFGILTIDDNNIPYISFNATDVHISFNSTDVEIITYMTIYTNFRSIFSTE